MTLTAPMLLGMYVSMPFAVQDERIDNLFERALDTSTSRQ